jgi:hypothetical protein
MARLSKKKDKSGNWLKRIVIALIAAIAGLLFTKKKVMAPSRSSDEYRLPPVPDVPPAGPEEATPLTEEEQKQLAGQQSEAAGESGNVSGAISRAGEATPNGAGGTGSTGAPPAPISYEAAARGAAEAEAARAEGTEEGRQRADAIDQRMYFGAPPAGEAPVEPASDVESVDNPEAETADAGDERASADQATGDAGAGESASSGGDATGQSASTTSTAAGIRAQSGDTAPDATSEGYDVSDGAEHAGRIPVDHEDPTSVGLDIDVDLEDDEASAPDPTSEGFDTGSGPGGDSPIGGAASAGALTSGEGYVRLSGDERECPEDYPIKGNATSRIYHQPGESSYDATIPEMCFATAEVAESMGFRPRKR